MTDPINHAREALQHIDWTHEWQAEEGSTTETNFATVLIAQAHATLALAEQQRIANLIALSQTMNSAIDVTGWPERRIKTLMAIDDKIHAGLGLGLDGGAP